MALNNDYQVTKHTALSIIAYMVTSPIVSLIIHHIALIFREKTFKGFIISLLYYIFRKSHNCSIEL